MSENDGALRAHKASSDVTDGSVLSQLAERCEKATGPDRELDVAIVYALHPDIGVYLPHCAGEEFIFWHEPYRKKPAPKFTSSIDDALTLIPSLNSDLSHYHDDFIIASNGGGVSVLLQYAVNIGHWSERWERFRSQAPTLPLAICGASLKARAALLKATGEQK